MMDSLLPLEWDFIQTALSSRALSPLGQALAHLHKPYDSSSTARLFRKKISEFSSLAKETRQSIHSFLSPVEDIEPYLERSSKEGILLPGEIYACGAFFETVGLVGSEIRTHMPEDSVVREIFMMAPKIPDICSQIKKSVTPLGQILDTASRKLFELRQKRITKKNQFESLLNARIQSWFKQGILQDQFYDVFDGRYVVPVKTSEQSKLGGVLLGRSNTGQSVFLEPLEITTGNNELKELDLQIRDEELRILAELSAKIGELSTEYTPWVPVLGELDLILSAALLALEWELHEGVESRSNGELSPALFLKDLFHPQLKASLGFPVLNTFYLDSPSSQSLILSGPNTGGKTVLLKAAGLCALMHKAGLFIPAAAGSTIPFYHSVFALIGDHQNIAEGLSSFSSQIKELDETWKSAKSPSLLLIDEMLSSTNPEDATALSLAFLDAFLKKKIHSIVSTHFTELALRAKETGHVKIGAMEFKNGKPTYRLRLDELGTSHALEVAEQLGVHSSILQKAHEYVAPLKAAFETAQKLLKERETAQELAHQEKMAELDLEKSNWKEESARLEKERKQEVAEFIKRLEEKMQSELEAMNTRLVSLARQGHDRIIVKKIVEQQEKLTAELKEEVQKRKRNQTTSSTASNEIPDQKSLKAGDSVRLTKMSNQLGKILELSVDGKSAVVSVGNFRVTQKLADLFAYEAAPQTRKPQWIQYESEVVSARLDLRGVRLEEALRKTESYLDQALRSGLSSVTVITGHGTGALKNAVRELLKTLPYVTHYEAERESDDGALRISLE